MCGGRLAGVMKCSHDVCMVVNRGVVSLCSFLSSVDARRSEVALRISMEVRREDLGPALSPFGSLAI